MMRFDGQTPDDIALRLAHIAWEAGRVLRGMESALVDKRIKDDGTPTTAADLAAEQLIIRRLSEAWDGVPVVAEPVFAQSSRLVVTAPPGWGDPPLDNLLAAARFPIARVALQSAVAILVAARRASRSSPVTWPVPPLPTTFSAQVPG